MLAGVISFHIAYGMASMGSGFNKRRTAAANSIADLTFREFCCFPCVLCNLIERNFYHLYFRTFTFKNFNLCFRHFKISG